MISVIVLSYNDSEYAKDCIDSIVEKTHCDYEIILINNGSSLEHTKFLDVMPSDHYIKLKENKGLPIGYNIGIDLAIRNKSDYVCLMNADTKVVTDGWLTNMSSVVNNCENPGMVAAMTNQIANVKQNLTHRKGVLPLKIIDANWVGLGMTLIPIAVIKKVGFLDENMSPMAGVDVEYSLQLLESGYKIYIDGFTYVWHKGKVSLNQLKINYKDLQKRNIKYIKEKHPETWELVF